MICVMETSPNVFKRIAGNPVLLSLDGQVKTSLRAITATHWTHQERAKFGVYVAEPFVVPEGKVIVGQPRYEKQGDKVVEVYNVEDVPVPEPRRDVFAELDTLTARVAALEAR